MANIKISDLTSAAAATGTQQFEVNESGTSKKVTGSQLATYIEGEISSSPSFTGQVSVDAGSASAPSITKTGDNNTGIYFPAADTIGLSTGGTLRVSVDASGNLVTTGNIELGNTDTTISRSAAGVIAVEGGVIPKENRANTFTDTQTINGAPLNLNSNSDYTPQLTLTNAGATGVSAPYYILKRARGTYSSPTIVSSGDQVGTLLFQAHNGTVFQSAASIDAQVDGTPGTSDMPGRLIFKTTPDGGSSLVERMRIDSNGNVGIGRTASAGYKLQTSATIGANDGTVEVFMAPVAASLASIIGNVSNHDLVFYQNNAEAFRVDTNKNVLVKGPGGLGYGTGSGGTVTQLTSKTTGVTLNKTNGQITTAADALAAGASATFTVTNSTISASDVIIAQSQNINYSVRVNNAAAGSFQLTLKNESAISLSQAVTINFAMIQAVIS